MDDGSTLLTRDDVRDEAGGILRAMDTNGHDRVALQENWRRLWQLLREAQVSVVQFQSSDGGPWHLIRERHDGPHGLANFLTDGNFSAQIWPPEDARSAIDLTRLLNWAGVRSGMHNRRLTDQDAPSPEIAREAAERRREQAELHRRQSEEGRHIAESLRVQAEILRDHEEALRLDSEHLRDAQEGGREVAEHARDMSEVLRKTAEEARASMKEARDALVQLKEFAQRQRAVLERQEKALAALEKHVSHPD